MSLLVFFVRCRLRPDRLSGRSPTWSGRKAPLYFGLALFALGSIGAALSPTVEWLIAFRFVQGLGACAGMVIPRAIVRDMHTGTRGRAS